MLEFFAPRRVLAVEVRGRGRSEAPAAGYSVADHARDLAAVLDEAGVDRFHLMTFSRGTSWGLQLALDEPSWVASVSIGDYRAAEIQLTPEFVEMQLATRFRGIPLPERMSPDVLVAIGRESKARELWDDLRSLPCPLLVARPGGSGILDDDAVARYLSVRPDAEIVTVPDAPHDLFRVDRLFYPRAVADFLARRCPGL